MTPRREPTRGSFGVRKALCAGATGLALLIGLSSLFSPVTARPATATQLDIASADWINKTKTGSMAVSVMVERTMEDDQTRTIATVTKGRCSKKFYPGEGRTLICTGSPHRYTLTADAFQIDPTLGVAHLTIETPRWTHSVTWVGEDQVADRDIKPEISGGGAGVAIGQWRSASASGSLFGKDFQVDSKRDVAYLFSFVRAHASTDTD